MKIDSKYPLLAKPIANTGIYQSVTREEAGWQYLNFQARLMKKGEIWEGDTGENEYGIILLGGDYSVITGKGNWKTVNGRKDVFSGIAHTLYLPRHTGFKLEAESELLDIAYGWCETDEDHPAYFKLPEEAAIEIRGGDNATRQINSLIQPGFDCHRLISVEVYTPSGNWSSFPAHKHDERKIDRDGKLKEARLEEIYFYKTDKPQGFAIQRIYTDDRGLDEVAVAQNNDVVLIPRGYHPVVAGHGYHIYYLNFLTGSDQSLANSDDPDHQWIYHSWKGKDPRVPLVKANHSSAIVVSSSIDVSFAQQSSNKFSFAFAYQKHSPVRQSSLRRFCSRSVKLKQAWLYTHLSAKFKQVWLCAHSIETFIIRLWNKKYLMSFVWEDHRSTFIRRTPGRPLKTLPGSMHLLADHP